MYDINTLAAVAGSDTIYGGSGSDTIYGDNGNNLSGSDAGGNDVIYAGNGTDKVYGEGGDDTIYGENGNDILDGGAGNDVINGGEGRDVVFGGAGDDTIKGADSQDLLFGGSGNDVIGSNDTSRHCDGGENGSDTIYGDGRESYSSYATATVLGNDTIYAGRGSDIIFGDNGDNLNGSGIGGDDTIYAGNGNDKVYGEGGNDQLFGEKGYDTISGGAGNDIITGGLDADKLTGGAGHDTFAFSAAVTEFDHDDHHHHHHCHHEGYDHDHLVNWSDSTVWAMDTVTDFQGIHDPGSTENTDKLDLHQLLGDTVDLTWSGTTPTPNGVWFTKGTDYCGNQVTYVYADITGNPDYPELAIKLMGWHDLTNNDFIGVTNASVTIDPSDIAGAATEIADNASGENINDHSAAGTINFTDTDFGSVHTATVTPQVSGYVGSFTLGALDDVNTNVGWSFNVNDSALDSLAADEQLIQKYDVTIDDGAGGAAIQTVTITIQGTNDGVTITSGVQAGTVTEDAADTASLTDTLSVAGTVAFDDVDLTDGHTASFAQTSGTTTLGTFALGSVNDDGTSAGSVGWTYNLNNSAAQYLAADESVTEVYTVTVTDDFGATASQLVTITITGTNDAPVITTAVGGNEDTAVEAGVVPGDADASGILSSSDVDTDATATWSGDATGTYGSFAINAATGAWTYTLNNADSDTDALKEGAIVTDTFLATVTDDFGATASQLVTITITGTNDAPVITTAVGGNEDTAVEAGVVPGDADASGILSSSDVDTDATATWSGDATGTYGSFAINAATGAWTYTLNNADSDTDALKEGAIVTDTFLATVTDDFGATASQLVTITITGTNDAPVVSGNIDIAPIAEDSGARIITQAELLANASDVDNGASLTAANLTIVSGNGVLVDNLDGTWTYTPVSNDDTSVSFSYTVSDGIAAPVTASASLDITPVNDAPELMLHSTVNVSHSVGDNFQNIAYNNNTGDTNWSTNWTETGDDGDAAINGYELLGFFITPDDVGITADPAPNMSLRLSDFSDAWFNSDGDETDVAIQRTVDLSGATSATLSFDYRSVLSESDDDVYIQISTDGTNFTTLLNLDSSNDNSTYQTASYDISAYISSNTTIRFVATGTMEEADLAFIDNINIAYTVPTVPTYIEKGDAIVLDGAATISDIELDTANSYAGATLTLGRQGGAVSTDVFGGTGALALSGGDVIYGGNTVGAYNQTNGTLTITFNANATTAVADGVLQSLTYASTSDAPSATAEIVYTFSDGNVGAQGTGGALSATGSITVNITAINDAPVITSNGGGDTAVVNVAENSTSVTAVTAIDPDLTTPTYAIVGGADAAKFHIDSATGVLTFVSAPNFESPTDSGTNNVYDVIVQATDGSLIDTQSIAVTVTDVNDAPVLSLIKNVRDEFNSASYSNNDGSSNWATNWTESGETTNASSGDIQVTTESSNLLLRFGDNTGDGTDDSIQRSVNLSGADSATLSFDYKRVALDSSSDQIRVQIASDGVNFTTIETIQGAANDSDYLTFTADISSYISATTVLRIIADGDLDSGDYVYIDNVNIAYTVTPTLAAVDEDAGAPVGAVGTLVSSLVDLNPPATGNNNVSDVDAGAVTGIAVTAADAANGTWFYSLDGGANWIALGTPADGSARLLAADANTRLYFQPNADYDGSASITFRAWDQTSGANGDLADTTVNGGSTAFSTATATATADVTAVNDAPVITSDGGGVSAALSIAENSMLVTDVNASDIDNPTLTYSIAGGADAAKFSIDSATGVLTFKTAPNFESPTDSDANNIYDVTVQASDGILTDTQNIAVTVTNDPTEVPTATVNITAIVSDSGISSTDFITNDTSLTVSGTNTALGAGEKIQVSSDGLTWADVVQNTATTWSYADPTDHSSSFTYQSRVINADNNVGNIDSQVVTIDTAAPTATVDITAIANDTGVSSTDFITSDTLLTVSGTNTALGSGEKIQISGNGGSTWSDVTQNTGTTWSFVDVTTHNTSFTYQVRVVDTAGNIGNTDSQAITIDTSAAAPGAPDLIAASDSGSSSTDNITSDNTPTVTGSGAESGATVTLYEGAIVLGMTTADGSGNWTITSSTLGSGTHTLTAKQTDIAGNTSAASAGLAVTIDTTATVPAITSIATDSGAIGDHITNDTSLTISGTAEANSTVTVYRDGVSIGTATANGSGAWSIADGTPLSNGNTYQYSAMATDLAGNTSGASANYAVTVDTTAPSAPSAPDLMSSSDSGSSNTDNITNDNTPTVTGSGAEAGATVTLYDTNGTTVLGTTTADGSGNWTITSSTLSNGTHTLTAKVTDAAGNASAASGGLAVTIDTSAPTVTVTSNPSSVGYHQTSTITYQFSEAVVNFDESDTTVYRGTLSNFTPVDGDTYTESFYSTSFLSSSVSVTSNSYSDLAGNLGSGGSVGNLPAGVAGEPINLALTDPTADENDLITLTITGMPSDWVLNSGTKQADGSWIVETNDPGSLTVTTPAGFTGALVLNVAQSWTNADGTTGSAVILDNVEAFAPSSPIFAVSADDHLTGSSGDDLFVFAQPIANDVIHNFDAVADKIDLIGFTGINGFADLTIANDGNGNAVITLASGSTITVLGIDAAALTANNFAFNAEPVTVNADQMTIGDGAILPLGGTIENSGTIQLNSTGNETDLEILYQGAKLQGGGQVLLSDSDRNVIFGGSADTVLTNVDNTISGAGQLGAGQMTLVNEGLILASGINSLVIDTGSNVITNAGTLEATGDGGLIVESAVNNAGHLWANGGDITFNGDVTGAGDATISGAATLKFGGASAADTNFADGGDGILSLEQSSGFTGVVSGFNEGDAIDLGDVAFGNGTGTTIRYADNGTGTAGTLIVSDGIHTANIAIQGQYTTAGFEGTYDADNGTAVAYNSVHAGGNYDQLVLGGTGNDVLTGDSWSDLLVGGEGNDILVGGLGNDTLNGGGGADTFVLSQTGTANADHIVDYNALAGDKLDLSDMLDFSTGDDVLDFIKLTQDGDNTTVQVDVDGAANGANFVDVCTLDNYGASGTDQVAVLIDGVDHNLAI